MKLRVKKTGEIVELKLIVVNDLTEDHEVNYLNGERLTLKVLNSRFEDVKEPLIKDEKIRKAVRAWAEASYLRGAIFDFDDGTMILRDEKPRAYISFDGLDFCEFKHITAGYHTIEELCGEEEGC